MMRRRGFTLIELLVVIAIIGVLVAVPINVGVWVGLVAFAVSRSGWHWSDRSRWRSA